MNKNIKLLMKKYEEAEKKFIITEEEVEIIRFFKEIKCSICNRLPTPYRKNIRSGNDIFCEFCYNKLLGNKKRRKKQNDLCRKI